MLRNKHYCLQFPLVIFLNEEKFSKIMDFEFYNEFLWIFVDKRDERSNFIESMLLDKKNLT